MKISGLSCITKKIFLVFLGHPSVDCILLSWILNHTLQKVRMVGELQTTDCLHGCTYITHYHTLQMVAELFLQTWTAYTAGSAAYR